jgi:hypothetical protein
MANVDVYVPVYMVGADGSKAYQFAKLTAAVTTAKVPEGEVCVKSSSVTTTPAQELQPPATTT